MDLPEIDQVFLRELVKSARQRPHSVAWKDRDGTERFNALTQAEVVRLNQVAQKLRVSKSELMRQAAHVPVVKNPPAQAAPPA